MRLFAIIPPLIACALLGGCEGPAAPGERGVCWRMAGAASGRPAFAPIGRDVASLDDCAAELEALHLTGARRADGAYQGYFIFVDDQQIASSTGLTTFRYPVFQPSQRKEIDADLRGLIKQRGGRAPTAAEIAVERK
jgi:hypothetical protein